MTNEQCIAEAIEAKRRIEFEYFDTIDGEEKLRVVDPHIIYRNHKGTLIFVAKYYYQFSRGKEDGTSRNEIRSYKVDDIQNLYMRQDEFIPDDSLKPSGEKANEIISSVWGKELASATY